MSIDYGTATVTVSIPRSCLRYPGWVRMGAWAESWDDATATDYTDDALSGPPTQRPDTMTLSPKIYRN
jgi:hypothetical protein